MISEIPFNIYGTYSKNHRSRISARATNYSPNNPVYIHKIELPENTLDFLCSLCRYGSEEGKRGSHMLWSPDFSWWISEKPKAKAAEMKKPCGTDLENQTTTKNSNSQGHNKERYC